VKRSHNYLFAACLFFLVLIGCSKKEATGEKSGGEPAKQTVEKEQSKPTAASAPDKAQDTTSATKTSEPVFKALSEDVFTQVPDNTIRTGLKNNLLFCVFSPDSKRLALVDRKGEVTILDSSSWKPLKSFSATGPFKTDEFFTPQVAISPDFKWLVFGCRDKNVYVWNLETGKEERSLKGHPDFIRFMAFSPDSKRLVTGTNDPTLYVWDVATGDLIKKFSRGFGFSDYIAFTLDGKELLVPSYPAIQRFDPQTGTELGKQNFLNETRTMAQSPDGKLIAFDGSPSDKPSYVNVWERATGKIYTVPGFKHSIQKVAFVSNTILAMKGYPERSSSWEHLNLWDLESKQQLCRFKIWQEFAISPDGKILVFPPSGALPDLDLNIVDLPAVLKAK